MKTKVYLYIALLISFLFNIGFFFHARGNDKSHPYANVSDEYLNEQLGQSYAYLKLNSLSLGNIEGVLWKGNEDEKIKLHDQLNDYGIILYFSELSCFTCIKDQLASLNKMNRMRKKLNILLVTNHLRKDVLRELAMSKLEFPIFELGENSLTGLSDINKRFPTATISLFLKDSVVVSSFVSNSETNYFNSQFYESIYRFNSMESESK